MKLAKRKQNILSIFCHFFLKGKKNIYKQLQNLIQSGLNTKSICKFSNWQTGGRKGSRHNAISSSIMSTKIQILLTVASATNIVLILGVTDDCH